MSSELNVTVKTALQIALTAALSCQQKLCSLTAICSEGDRGLRLQRPGAGGDTSPFRAVLGTSASAMSRAFTSSDRQSEGRLSNIVLN